MKHIITILMIALVVSFGVIYAVRPHDGNIAMKPITPTKQGLINADHDAAVVVIATTNSQIQLSNTKTTTTKLVDKYIMKYLGQSIAYSTSNNTTTYYLPPRDYSVVSSAIMAVIDQYPNAEEYFTIVGNPITGVRAMKYAPTYRTDPLEFANKGGNDMNFYEAYAFANFQTPFTMIIIINPATYHVAYVLGNQVYDIYKTYNYQDYVKRVMYKYDPTVVYIAVFNTNTISLSPIPLLTNAHRMDVEANGEVNNTPLTIVQRKDYYMINYGSTSITRNGSMYTYNGVIMNYYPIDYKKIEPIDPVIAEPTNTNYIYINGTTYTLIPTSKIMDANGATIIGYQVLNGEPVGSITVTYLG